MPHRYVCIHGHFYQPPRENAWLEEIELQESAYPNHDWNERITDECYGPNARARVMDSDGWIVDIVSNYSRISFNVGPTLLAWMESRAPKVYQGVIDADRESMKRFGGHGSAMAQAYNHVIMPLCNDRDRTTQVLWGVKDFASRFGRAPEGMWLPETAANTATLETLAEHGVKFTVLAPRQAASVRPIEGGEWQNVAGRVDPSMPYLCRLPSGKTITLFFYDGPISQGVAFEGLLHSSERLAGRLMDGFDDGRARPQLSHIATDGESYGHHHRHGDMALAAAIGRIEANPAIRLTNYAEFLSLHPPTHEAQIIENSSWSCVHGIERWKSDCGCHSGGNSGWHQRWRAPLRQALDWLRDTVTPLYEESAGQLLTDPWAARDAYISVVLDRSPESIGAFMKAHARGDLSGADRTRVLQLMELQRHAMLMYTSCGWFFDDISGIETVQVIQYAGRVVQLAREVLRADLEEEFLSRLAEAKGNVPSRADGRQVYLQCVKPAAIDLLRVGAHYAVSSLFEPYDETARVGCYEVKREEYMARSAGRARLCIGRAVITSSITLESETLSFGVVHMGEHVLNCGVRPYQGPEAFAELVRGAQEAFDRADFPEILRHMDRAFGSASYSIASLFRDEQHKVVRGILKPTLAQIDASFQQIYGQNAPLVRFLRTLNLPVPRRLQFSAGFVLNDGLRDALGSESPDLERIRALLDEANGQGVELEGRNLAFALEGPLERLIELVGLDSRPESLKQLERMVRLADELPFEVNLWQVQDAYHRQMQAVRPVIAARAGERDEDAARWIEAFDALGTALKIRRS